MTAPPRYKLALLNWLGIYPVITVTLWCLRPLVSPLALPLQTLVLTAVLVPTMVYVLVPLLTRLFGRWLRPPSGPSPASGETNPDRAGASPPSRQLHAFIASRLEKERP